MSAAGAAALFLPLNFLDSVTEMISIILYPAGYIVCLPSAVLFFFGAPFPLCFALSKKQLINGAAHRNAANAHTLRYAQVGPPHRHPKFRGQGTSLSDLLLLRLVSDSTLRQKGLLTFGAELCFRSSSAPDCKRGKIYDIESVKISMDHRRSKG